MQSSSCLFGNRIYNIFYIKIYLFLILLQLLKKIFFFKIFFEATNKTLSCVFYTCSLKSKLFIEMIKVTLV